MSTKLRHQRVKTQRVWFTMVDHPLKGWIRVGKAYGSRDVANQWAPFVKASWRGLRSKVSQCTLRFIDGVMDEKSKDVLSKKYNMDAP